MNQIQIKALSEVPDPFMEWNKFYFTEDVINKLMEEGMNVPTPFQAQGLTIFFCKKKKNSLFHNFIGTRFNGRRTERNRQNTELLATQYCPHCSTALRGHRRGTHWLDFVPNQGKRTITACALFEVWNTVLWNFVILCVWRNLKR